ncbi:MAG TPA: metalloregulator ArsR/SmtB family transcription factor [Acidimicrobiia bacterium]|nr:metalloregulator ArsR/SmtB family transcription factor [Acidimicrobiia bacterium]
MKSGSRPAKDQLFDGFAQVAAALASGRRLEIVELLAQAPRSVDEIAGAIEQSVANTSHHLRRLALDGLVTHRRRGRQVVYQLASDQVYGLWKALQQVAAAHHHELTTRAERYLGQRAGLGTLGLDELKERVSRGEDLLLIDVRPVEEYAAGHIPGAISVPPDQLELLDELIQNHATAGIVAYCRGPYCVFADQAIRYLEARGRRAWRLHGGVRDWAMNRSNPLPPIIRSGDGETFGHNHGD